MSDFEEELEDIDDTLYELDTASGEVRLSESTEPDASRALNVRGSASLIKAYQTCPAQAYGRITRQKQGKTLALVNGIAVHSALESYARDEGKDPQVVYTDSLKYEAERNEVRLNSDTALKAKAVGEECVGAGMAILDSDRGTPGRTLKERIDKDLIEVGFTFTRNGFLYVGKMDFMVFKPVQGIRYSVCDWKTGKNPPKGKRVGEYYELDKDIQFTLYSEGSIQDERLKLRTFGKYPEWSVYLHLRGATQEWDEKTGKRLPKNSKKLTKPLQYEWPTKRDKEENDWQFATVIEPEMQNMADGRWGRRPGRACDNCGFFNKAKLRCEVEIPADAELKKQNQLSLIDHTALTESRMAKLKPYTGKDDVLSQQPA